MQNYATGGIHQGEKLPEHRVHRQTTNHRSIKPHRAEREKRLGMQLLLVLYSTFSCCKKFSKFVFIFKKQKFFFQVVDDIIDSGVTLSQLVNTLKSLEVCQVWTSLLLSKRVPRKAKADEHFVAFNIPDKFIVGHGLDYNQVFRDLNHICVMSDQGIEKYRHHN